MLFQLDLTGGSPAEVAKQFWAARETETIEREFADRLVHGVRERRDRLDRWILGSAVNWRLERMAVVDRNVLRLAVFEMLDEAETPSAVIIDEAVEVAKKFGGPESGSFINGILDAIQRRIGKGGVEGPADEGERPA